MEKSEQIMDHTRKYVRELRDFYLHVAIWLVVGTLLFIIDVFTPGGPWFYWPVSMWGVAVAINAVSVFRSGRLLDTNWENRKVEEFRARAAHPGRP
jgi:hypothetical protein